MERTEAIKTTAHDGITAPPGAGLDLSKWQEFQEGLSSLLGISISLNDDKGECVVPPSPGSAVCEEMNRHAELRELCERNFRSAALRALGDGDTHIFKCHANRYAFAMPVFLGGRAFVIMGGMGYLEGRERESFNLGTNGRLDASLQGRLMGRLRTITPESIFSIPETLRRLAVPYLESLQASNNASFLQEGESPATSFGAGRLAGPEYSALLDIYKSISTVIDKDTLYDIVLARSSDLIGAERASLMIFDKAEKAFRIKASRGIEKSIAENVRIKTGQGISGRTAQKGTPLVVRDITKELPWVRSVRPYRTPSFISAPLKLYDRVIGVINLADKRDGSPFTQQDLFVLLSVSHFVTIALERGAYYSMSERLKTISMTDPLTGLFNRRFFKNRLFEEAERVRRLRDRFTAFIIDVDDFKAFNDRWGHLAGDNALKLIARTIKGAVRTVDVVVRYGGEEFAVILPHTSKADSRIIAERIRSDVERLEMPPEVKAPSPTISIGIAEFPGDARNTDDLIYRADAAMYQAKRRGKNRVVLYAS